MPQLVASCKSDGLGHARPWLVRECEYDDPAKICQLIFPAYNTKKFAKVQEDRTSTNFHAVHTTGTYCSYHV